MQLRSYDYSYLIFWLLVLLSYIYIVLYDTQKMNVLSCNSTILGGRYYNSYFTNKEIGSKNEKMYLKKINMARS